MPSLYSLRDIGDHFVRRCSSQAALHAPLIFSTVGANVACPLPLYAHSNPRSVFFTYWALHLLGKRVTTLPEYIDFLTLAGRRQRGIAWIPAAASGIRGCQSGNLHNASLPVPTEARQATQFGPSQHDPAPANQAAWLLCSRALDTERVCVNQTTQARQILDTQSLPPSPLGAASPSWRLPCTILRPLPTTARACIFLWRMRVGGCACVRVCARVDDLEAAMRCWPCSSAPRRAVVSCAAAHAGTTVC